MSGALAPTRHKCEQSLRYHNTQTPTTQLFDNLFLFLYQMSTITRTVICLPHWIPSLLAIRSVHRSRGLLECPAQLMQLQQFARWQSRHLPLPPEFRPLHHGITTRYRQYFYLLSFRHEQPIVCFLINGILKSSLQTFTNNFSFNSSFCSREILYYWLQFFQLL